MQMKHSKVIMHSGLHLPRLGRRCRIPKLATARFDVKARLENEPHWFNSEAMVENNFGRGDR